MTVYKPERWHTSVLSPCSIFEIHSFKVRSILQSLSKGLCTPRKWARVSWTERKEDGGGERKPSWEPHLKSGSATTGSGRARLQVLAPKAATQAPGRWAWRGQHELDSQGPFRRGQASRPEVSWLKSRPAWPARALLSKETQNLHFKCEISWLLNVSIIRLKELLSGPHNTASASRTWSAGHQSNLQAGVSSYNHSWKQVATPWPTHLVSALNLHRGKAVYKVQNLPTRSMCKVISKHLNTANPVSTNSILLEHPPPSSLELMKVTDDSGRQWEHWWPATASAQQPRDRSCFFLFCQRWALTQSQVQITRLRRGNQAILPAAPPGSWEAGALRSLTLTFQKQVMLLAVHIVKAQKVRHLKNESPSVFGPPAT